jgi:tetratricopeptide (TPR) repeat protein
MIDSQSDGREAKAPRARRSWMQRGILATVCALVIGIYAYTAHSGFLTSSSPNAADDYYNLLVQGFRAGQLSLKKEVPPGLAQLADPYDPPAHSRYGALDLSYYNGKLYLYFGVTPAVMLFWPYVVLTGHYLLQKDAAVIFCVVGFLVSVGLLCALWRRYFAEVNARVVAAGTLALGLVTGTPLLLARCDVYEVSISCGYALTMLAVAAIWKALHEPERRCRWLAAASVAYGLAVGARPSLLFGAIILLVPVAQAWRERRTVLAPLLAATVPLALIGLGLMIYNFLRFDSPLEFGWRYMLAGDRQDTAQRFHLRYLWFNFRVYFLEPARWGRRFPFVHDISIPTVPAGHGRVDEPFGVLANIPLVWLALAVPLAWRGRSTESCSSLRRFVTAVGMFFGICTLTLCLFFAACTRYEVEFLPALVLLAVIGILSVERALAPTAESGLACQPLRRRAMRWGWSLLLGFSVAFNLLTSVERCAEPHNNLGRWLLRDGKVTEAIGQYEQALRLKPDFAEAHYNLADALEQAGRVQKAIGYYEQVLRLKPDFAEAHNNLGAVLMEQGRLPEAISHYEQALRLKPDFAEAHYNLGVALGQAGRVQEAIGNYEQALRLKPDFAEAHYNLGVALVEQGGLQEAIGHYEQALRIRPDYTDVHNNLGIALVRLGRVQEAIEHYQQALRLKPNFAAAHYNLGVTLMGQGRLQEAIGHYEQALRVQPDYTDVLHNTLGIALVRLGRVQEAIEHYQQALRLKPDFAEAHNNLGAALMGQGRLPEAISHYEQAVRIKPDFAEAHYNLGDALEQAGRVQEAIGHYEQVLRIKPDFVQARNALARLQARR